MEGDGLQPVMNPNRNLSLVVMLLPCALPPEKPYKYPKIENGHGGDGSDHESQALQLANRSIRHLFVWLATPQKCATQNHLSVDLEEIDDVSSEHELVLLGSVVISGHVVGAFEAQRNSKMFDLKPPRYGSISAQSAKDRVPSGWGL